MEISTITGALHYQVLVWIAAVVFSLTLMVFATMFCMWCRKDPNPTAETPGERQEPLDASQEFRKGDIQQPTKGDGHRNNYEAINSGTDEKRSSVVQSSQAPPDPNVKDDLRANSIGRKQNLSVKSGIESASERITSVIEDQSSRLDITESSGSGKSPTSELEGGRDDGDSVTSVEVHPPAPHSLKFISEPRDDDGTNDSKQDTTTDVASNTGNTTAPHQDQEARTKSASPHAASDVNEQTVLEGGCDHGDSATTSDKVHPPVPHSPKFSSEARDDDSTGTSKQDTTTDVASTAPDPNQEARSKSALPHVASNVKEQTVVEHHLNSSNLKGVTDKAWEARVKWFEIGLQLEMDVAELESIEKANLHQPEKCFTVMLTSWLRQKEATWEKLIEALNSKQVGHAQLAESIHTSLSEMDEHVGVVSANAVNTLVTKPEEEDGIAFKCKCGRHISIIDYLDEKCPCSAPHFPYLNHGKLTPTEQRSLEKRLHKDTKIIITEFTNLIRSMRTMLKTQQVDPKDIISDFLSLAPSDPSSPPILSTLDPKNVHDICDVIIELQRNSYISFFNYHIVEYLIQTYGSHDDIAKLDKYVEHFQQFCERNVFEVPQHIYGPAPSESEMLAFKVTSQKQWMNFTSKDTLTAQSKVADELGLKSCCFLPLIDVSKGCVVLTFALPQVIMGKVKPCFDRFQSINVDGYLLHVLSGPPGKPVVTGVTSDSISLKWTKPEYQGSQPLTHYVITYCSVTDPRERGNKKSQEEHVTVKGLSRKDTATFIFRVKAFSKFGAGMESRASNPIELPVHCHNLMCI